MYTRRSALLSMSAGMLAAGAGWPAWAVKEENASLAEALHASTLIYITPLKRNGDESKCHAEVWYLHDAGSVYVVTAKDAWRARAMASGLNEARLWVGEFGPWEKAADKFRAAPSFIGRGSVVSDSAMHEAILAKFGKKYVREWSLWGPRFRNGLADGSRVMLAYQGG